MNKSTAKEEKDRMVSESRSFLDRIIQEGAQRMLQEALKHEVEEYLSRMEHQRMEDGRRAIVRNGHLPDRDLVTGAGPVRIRQERVRDRSGRSKFTSRILPPYMRRTPSVDELIPVLYLKGVSPSGFSEALKAILRPNAAGLSATNIVRMKEGWVKDYERWAKRDLSGKRYVY